ncbi:PIN domain-containing protein [Halorussus halobius]|uniref:PIN domain-containing protein n=1 Tax=Halorussus halobius TaxID=1710537 RepID=UPI001FCF246E|nr:PIN domain-containing protein [Halorussus halobius]
MSSRNCFHQRRDYLDGDDDAEAFLDAHADRPFFAPTLALFEVYRGAARTGGREQVERVADGLDWLEPLPLTDATVREAALVEAELLDAGDRINLGDVLVAGICRHDGANVVTRDHHFDRVENLDALAY